MQHILPLSALLFSSVLTAQTVCDSVHVDSIRYAPFGDGLHVSLYNESMELFTGPTIDVLDANGDTLVEGTLEFFGLTFGPSLHQVHLSPPPATPFTGTMRLNYNDGNGLASCNFPVANINLCPPDGCVPLEVFAYQQGANPVVMDLDWSVTDADNNELNSGVLHMDGTGFGYVVSDLCLLRGAYTLHVAQPVAAGNLIQVGMTQASFAYTDGVFMQLPVGGAVDLPFDYYLQCIDASQGINAHEKVPPSIMIEGRALRISSNDGSALGTFILLDSSGRVARTISANTSIAFSDLSGLASGAYLLRSLDSTSSWAAQRIILY